MSVPLKGLPLTQVKAHEKKKVALHPNQLAVCNHKLLTAEQPLVTVQFNKEVASKGKLYPPDVDFDIPLDQAHSLHTHIKK